MKKLITVAGLAVLLALIVGCGEKVGGGTRSIAAGTTTTTAAYGIRAGKQLGFLMITDLGGKGTTGSGGTTWTGHIKPETGSAIFYKGQSRGLEINGTEHDFASGRVFLVSARKGKISVTRLNIPIGDTRYDAEIDRIATMDEVQEFLRN